MFREPEEERVETTSAVIVSDRLQIVKAFG